MPAFGPQRWRSGGLTEARRRLVRGSVHLEKLPVPLAPRRYPQRHPDTMTRRHMTGVRLTVSTDSSSVWTFVVSQETVRSTSPIKVSKLKMNLSSAVIG